MTWTPLKHLSFSDFGRRTSPQHHGDSLFRSLSPTDPWHSAKWGLLLYVFRLAFSHLFKLALLQTLDQSGWVVQSFSHWSHCQNIMATLLPFLRSPGQSSTGFQRRLLVERWLRNPLHTWSFRLCTDIERPNKSWIDIHCLGESSSVISFDHKGKGFQEWCQPSKRFMRCFSWRPWHNYDYEIKRFEKKKTQNHHKIPHLFWPASIF